MHRFEAAWISLRSSLWFVPSLIVAGCVALAIVLIEVDAGLSSEVLARWPRLFGAGAEGSRGMLSAIASAMITVAGVVFSITIVALSLTSSQYTSRVLRNFMRDRSNQVVLGAFVGIYAYCLVVLRTIRGSGEGPFVPSVATLGAIVLAFVGIALLIHFIHHISSAIQAARILAAIREETSATIERLFPERLGRGDSDSDDEDAVAGPQLGSGHAVTARRTGYIQNVGADALMQWACKHDAVVHLPYRIGAFVIECETLVEVHCERDMTDDVTAPLRGAFTIGVQPTLEQDVAFGIRQIVDIALKALSPAINDPTTARMCIDQLSALLVALATRKFPSRFRHADGRLRVIVERPLFEALLALSIEEIRFAAREQPVVLQHLVRVLRMIAEVTESSSNRRCILLELSRTGGAEMA